MSCNRRCRAPGRRGQRRAALVALLLSSMAFAALAAAEEGDSSLSLGEFAHGADLRFERKGALQTVLLPVSVYRSSVESGLADLRVFNAAGEVVPHAVRILGAKEEPDAALSDLLPFYRLPDDPSDGSVVISPDGLREFRVEARVSDAQSSINIESKPRGGASDGEGPVRGYLIDTEGLPRGVVGLDLELADSDDSFLASLRVRSSDDLQRFSVREGTTGVARLEQSGQILEIDRLRFAATDQRYLELTLPGKALPFQIVSVRAELARESPPAHRMHEKLGGREIEGEPGAILYDAGGNIPVDRIQVTLPRRDSVIEARLLTADAPEGPWRSHFAGLLYDIEHEERFRNPPVSKPATTDRYFKLVVSQKGGGVGPEPPVLDIAWRPAQLLFVARGDGPFTLAYGRSGAEASSFDFATLRALTQTRELDLPRASARLGPERSLAGASALEPRREPTETRVILLWGVLVVAVAILLAFSVRLIREMQS